MPGQLDTLDHQQVAGLIGGRLRRVKLLLGHTKNESTARHLGIEVDDAHAVAEEVEV
jgi:hypothetical protein